MDKFTDLGTWVKITAFNKYWSPGNKGQVCIKKS